MRSFFLPGLTTEQIAQLTTAGVTHYMFDVRGGVPGVVIDETSLDAAGTALNLSFSDEARTEYEGVFSVRMSPTARASGVPAPAVGARIEPIPAYVETYDESMRRIEQSLRRLAGTPMFTAVETDIGRRVSVSPPVIESLPVAVAATAVQPKKVYVAKWSDDYYGAKALYTKAVEEVLLPKIDKNIILSYCGGCIRGKYGMVVPSELVASGQDYIWIHLGEGRNTGEYAPTPILGVRIRRDRVEYTKQLPSPVILSDPDNNFDYLEMNDKEIWLLLSSGYDDNPEDLSLFKKILQEIATELSYTPEQKEEREKNRAETARKLARTKYVQTCAWRIGRAITDTERRVESLTTEARILTGQLAEKIRIKNGLIKKLPSLKANNKADSSKYEKEFDKLTSLKFVTDLQAKGDKFEIFTRKLYCKHPKSGKLHEIGRFRIDIKVDNGPEIRFHNLDRKVNAFKSDMNAPHVYSNGTACFGSIGDSIPELLANYEITALVMLGVQFLQSVNINDTAGMYIYKWPEVAEGEDGELIIINQGSEPTEPVDADEEDYDEDEDEYEEEEDVDPEF